LRIDQGRHRHEAIRDDPDEERERHRVASCGSFAREIACACAAPPEVTALLDGDAFLRLLGRPVPSHTDELLQQLVEEDLLVARRDGRFDVRNAAAILCARDLSAFRHLRRKMVRVVTYPNARRDIILHEHVEPAGYATGFQSLVRYINTYTSRHQAIVGDRRGEPWAYPEELIREPLANALVHQDFSMRGDAPLVEIFSDRIELTNSGASLVPPERWLNALPRSRNEALAALMRRLGIGEGRGSGIDTVVRAAEQLRLPAPDFRVVTNRTRVVIFAPRSSAGMRREERLRAAYQQACLRWVSHQPMTNSSLRQRLGISERSRAMVSRVISDAVHAGLLKLFDPASKSRKFSQYVPFWASVPAGPGKALSAV
jgi:ATP-dependent DNA helicase RecG